MIQCGKRKGKMKRCIFLGVLTAALLLMTGCGDKLVDLTDEEEAKIVTYASHIIAKYNKKQPDGLCYVPVEVPDTEDASLSQEPDASQPTETEAETETGTADLSPVELPEGYHDPDEFADVPTTTGTNVDAITPGGEGSSPDAVPMELSDVIGIEGFDMKWTGTSTADDYMDPSGATLATPNRGNRYVIMTVTITNTTDSDLRCNIAELVPYIVSIVNGSERLNANQMLVSTDFATYNADIPAGESVDTYIFFQRKASEIADSDTYGLEVTLNGVTGEITEQ